jgi:hypothetical protein
MILIILPVLTVIKNIQFNPATFYWSVCTKPGKWAVVYICLGLIDFAGCILEQYGIVLWFLLLLFLHPREIYLFCKYEYSIQTVTKEKESYVLTFLFLYKRCVHFFKKPIWTDWLCCVFSLYSRISYLDLLKRNTKQYIL